MSNPNQKMSNELLIALESGTLEHIKNVISQLSVEEINYCNKQGQTALQIAVKNGDEELVRLLVQCGCDIDRGNYSGQTALFLACWNNKPNMVILLTQLEANLNIQDNRGWTALMISSYNGMSEIVYLLLQQGADPRVEDSFGKRPIDRAKDAKIIKMLKDATDEFTLADLPMTSPIRGSLQISPQHKLNQSSRVKTPKQKLNSDDEVSQASEMKQNCNSSAVLQSQRPSTTNFNHKEKYTGVKEVESASNLRNLAAQLVSSGTTIIQQSINSYLEVSLQKQMALYEQNIWHQIMVKFEQRHYVTYNCLTEYLALKLRVGMAHLGIQIPDDLLIDYQQQEASTYEQGFSQMMAQETSKLQVLVKKLSGQQHQESANMDERIYQFAQTAGISTNQGPVIVQHMQQSFQGTCQRLFEKATQKLTIQLEQQCPLIERQLEERILLIVEKNEKEMKKRVENMVQKCIEQVKDRVNEVDGWINRREKSRSSVERLNKSREEQQKLQSSPQFKNNIKNLNDHDPNSSIMNSNNGSQNLQIVFQKQNNALKEKINQLKSTLSPKKLQ